jgi:hypothetical protein
MRRRVGQLFIFGAAAPLVILVSSAWACGVLATLKAAPSTAAPGQTVQASGVNYSDAVGVTFTPVQVRLDSRTGDVLQEVTPVAGRFSTTFQVPASAGPGDHLLIATQSRLTDGTPKAGTPGRTTMQVVGAAAGSSAPAASPWSGSNPGAPGGSGASADARDAGYAPLLGIGLSLVLLSIGVTLVVRDRATRGRRPLLGA